MLGAVHQTSAVTGGGVVQCEHFSDKRAFFRYGRPHFLVQNTSDFSKFMVCLHEQRGINFLRFCAVVLYGFPLCEFGPGFIAKSNFALLISMTPYSSCIISNKHLFRISAGTVACSSIRVNTRERMEAGLGIDDEKVETNRYSIKVDNNVIDYR